MVESKRARSRLAQIDAKMAVSSGGGALRRISETFATSPATGTLSLAIELPVSAARGLEPEATLRYDSGGGNGPFGIGWAFDVPAIRRRTNHGVPAYDDADVFLFGDDELVPRLRDDGMLDEEDRDGFRVRRFRTRYERDYARVERWVRLVDGETRWRTISRDAVTTWYGRGDASRIARGHAVFAWLADGRWDVAGNAIRWDWIAEDARGVAEELHETVRTESDRSSNRYLRRIVYGNRTPAVAGDDLTERDDWLFELVFDYDEGHLLELGDGAGGSRRISSSRTPRRPWTARPDAFSDRRPGFELRTSRLCRHALLFHRMPEQLGREATLVRAASFRYAEAPDATYLVAVEELGVARDGDVEGASVMPPLELAYSRVRVDDTVRIVAIEGEREVLATARLVDLDGDGAPGLLYEHAGGWWYRRNQGPGEASELFGAPERIARLPSLAAEPGYRLADIDGDGRLELVRLGRDGGSHARTDDGWSPFRAFARAPADHEDAWLVDLTGDGLADLLVADGDGYTWFPSRGSEGFAEPRRHADDGAGPRVIVHSPHELIAFADMTGDGLLDLVRVRAGEVSYWPSLGHGRFGRRIAMTDSPWLDAPDRFDPRRVRLADLDGSGPTDLVYCGRGGVTLHRNAAGNRWLAPIEIALAGFDAATDVDVVDLRGRGTACLVWTAATPGGLQLAWVDLMADGKPHLVTSIRNGVGGERRIHYTPSTRFAAADRLAGRPWRTRLPYPVQVVERVEVIDHVTGDRYLTRYAYHHGCHDGSERELAGFGLVEQWDHDEHETGADTFHSVPVLVRSWFHTGVLPADGDPGDALAAAAGELAGATPRLGGVRGLAALAPRELAAALRGLRGALLHREVFADDGSERAAVPYLVESYEHGLARLQPAAAPAGVPAFAPRVEATLRVELERTSDPRVHHEVALAFDAWGHALDSVKIAYGRAAPDPDPRLAQADRDAQRRTWVERTEHRYTNAIESRDDHRAPLPGETRRWELVGAATASWLTRDEIDELVAAARERELPAGDVDAALSPLTPVSQRLVARERTFYRRDDLTGILPIGSLEPRALAGERHELVLAPDQLAVLDARLTPELRAASGYLVDADGAWRRADTVWYTETVDAAADELAFARAHFFVPRRTRDAFDADTVVRYDAYDLLPVETIDPVGNRVTAGERDVSGIATTNGNDYRVLAPAVVTDANRNRTTVAYDRLGRAVAVAVGGKLGEQAGDTLDGVAADLDDAAIATWFADPDPQACARLLGGASTRIVFDDERARREGRPTWIATLTRERTAAEVFDAALAGVRIELAYTDGLGRVLQQRLAVEPGTGGLSRWLVTAWTVLDRKGAPVRTYEPFFAGDHVDELDARRGAATTTFRDPLGRAIGTLHADHTWTKVVFDPWKVERWDACDTCLLDPLADRELGAHTRALAAEDVLPTWRDARLAGAAGDDGVRAAAQAALHAGTPALEVLDSLGRTSATVAHQRRDGADRWLATRGELDVAGRARRVRDALGRIIAETRFDLAGSPLYAIAMDAGERFQLSAADGAPLAVWTARGHRLRHVHDAARRPVMLWVDDGAGERLIERVEYGEALGDAGNHRGRVHRRFDEAGLVRHHAYDLHGNSIRHGRRLLQDEQLPVDWSREPAVDDDELVEVVAFDALGRERERVSPDGSSAVSRYDRGGHLVAIEVAAPGGAPRAVLAAAEHDAHGRRIRTVHGNGVEQRHLYDSLSFRLARVLTVRGGVAVQDLQYHHDAAGNVIAIRDAAQPTTFFAGAVVSADAEYAYDALYQLVEASGREHAGQLGPTTWDERGRTGLAHPHDGAALRRYRERYEHDDAGNLVRIAHQAGGTGWVRELTYESGNQLARVASDGSAVVFGYDPAGNLASAPHLSVIEWDPRDRLRATARTAGGSPLGARYVYAEDGARIRRTLYRAAGTRRSERVYLGGFERYREYEADGATIALERVTLAVGSERDRIASLERRTRGDDGSEPVLDRYQYTDQLGSTALELDAGGDVISYEQFSPYGATTYQGMRGRAGAKRHRFVGAERDDESGFYRIGVRYYAPWLARWISCDPLGVAAGTNLYAYCENRPTVLVDPTGTIAEQADGSGHRRSKKWVAELKRRTAPGGEDAWKTPKHVLGHFKHEQRRTGSKSPYRWRNPKNYEGGHPYDKPFKTHGDSAPGKWEFREDNENKGTLSDGKKIRSANDRLPGPKPNRGAPAVAPPAPGAAAAPPAAPPAAPQAAPSPATSAAPGTQAPPAVPTQPRATRAGSRGFASAGAMLSAAGGALIAYDLVKAKTAEERTQIVADAAAGAVLGAMIARTDRRVAAAVGGFGFGYAVGTVVAEELVPDAVHVRVGEAIAGDGTGFGSEPTMFDSIAIPIGRWIVNDVAGISP